MSKSVRDKMKRFVDQAQNDIDRFIENMNSLDIQYQDTENEYEISMVQERATVLGLKEIATELKKLTQEYRDRLV